VRPSQLLKGSWADLNIDVAFGLAGIFDSQRDLNEVLKQKGMGPGIAAAAHAAFKAVP
jgi:hypothetical protein